MYCKNCGNVCSFTDTVCKNCGNKLDVSFYANNISQVKKEVVYTKEDNDKANLLSACSLLSFLLPFLLSFIFANTGLIEFVGNISVLLELVSFSLMIYVRIKYPKNIFGKVLMFLYIVVLILFIISIVVFLIACIDAISKCPG